MTRNAYVLHDLKLVIFWTPKAACTSIVNHLVYDVLNVSDFEDDLRRHFLGSSLFGHIKKILIMYGLRKPPHGLKDPRFWLSLNGFNYSGAEALNLATSGYHSIALIRDPYDRLVSAFWNKFVYRNGVKRHISNFEDMESFAYNFYLQVRERNPGKIRYDAYDGITFREFIMFVCDTLDDPSTPDDALNHHWNTQIPLVFEQLDFRYDELFSLAGVDDFFKRLSQICGSEYKPRRSNLNASTTSQRRAESLVDANSMSFADRFYSLASFEDAALRKRVEKSFERDYAYLQLAKDVSADKLV